MRRLGIAALVAATACALSAGVALALPEIRCGSANGWSVGVVGAASCGLALNVARSVSPNYRIGNSFTVEAFSPITGMSYGLQCHDETYRSGQSMAYECGVMTQRGGVVYLWQ